MSGRASNPPEIDTAALNAEIEKSSLCVEAIFAPRCARP
jgi:hypothetical protein